MAKKNSFGTPVVYSHGSDGRFRQRSITGSAQSGTEITGNQRVEGVTDAYPLKPIYQCVETKNKRFIQ